MSLTDEDKPILAQAYETSDTAANARIEALEQRVLMLETRWRPPQ